MCADPYTFTVQVLGYTEGDSSDSDGDYFVGTSNEITCEPMSGLTYREQLDKGGLYRYLGSDHVSIDLDIICDHTCNQYCDHPIFSLSDISWDARYPVNQIWLEGVDVDELSVLLGCDPFSLIMVTCDLSSYSRLRSLSNCSSLTELMLKNMGLYDFGRQFVFPPNVTKLNMDNNYFESLKHIVWPIHLGHLSMSNNDIASLKDLVLPPTVYSLRLENNRITTLDGFAMPIGMMYIHLECNLLEEFDARCISNTRMAKVTLWRNKITRVLLHGLPPSFCCLRIADNPVVEFDLQFTDIMNLWGELVIEAEQCTMLSGPSKRVVDMFDTVENYPYARHVLKSREIAAVLCQTKLGARNSPISCLPVEHYRVLINKYLL